MADQTSPNLFSAIMRIFGERDGPSRVAKKASIISSDIRSDNTGGSIDNWVSDRWLDQEALIRVWYLSKAARALHKPGRNHPCLCKHDPLLRPQ